MPSIEVVGMVYKSTAYTWLIGSQLMDLKSPKGWELSVRLIANDATPNVLGAIKAIGIPYDEYHATDPNEYYLNRVYQAWNHGVVSSDAENVVLVNSDMLFGPSWLESLLRHHDGVNIPCSRLVESGKMRSGTHGISADFGRSPQSLDREGFAGYAKQISNNGAQMGGLFMPCVFNRERFIECGMYPNGNLYSDGRFGSLSGNVIASGDSVFFDRLARHYAMKHVTVMDSIVYHIQEGEMDEVS
jgi:hypothetical protein